MANEKREAREKRLEYEHRRLMEDIGISFDRVMRAEGVLVSELAARTRLEPSFISDLIAGKADDIDLGTLTTLSLALGYRLIPDIRESPEARIAEADRR